MDRANMTMADEVDYFIEACAVLADVQAAADTAPRFRALQAEEVKLRKRLDEARKTEKEPYLEAGREIDARYNPMIAKIQEAVRAVTRALTQYMEAEDARLKAEARAAAEQAEAERERARALAAEAAAESDPFDAFDRGEEARRVEAQAASLARQAASPAKISVASQDGGRAGGLRIVGWIVEIEDAVALVGHYAGRTEVIELARKLAAAEAKATKGQAKIPGVRLTPDRRAA